MATLSERMAAIESDFRSHKEHCITDKADMKSEFRSVNNKLWVIGGTVILQLLVVIGYLVTEGAPWEQRQTQVADRK